MTGSAGDALNRAVAAYQSGSLSQAETAAREHLKGNPADVEALNLLGVVLRSTQRAREAISCYRLALSYNPNHAGAWTNLGNAARDVKQIETAIVCHERAIALQPHVAEFHHNLGIALMAANRFAAATAAYSRALLLKPGAAQMTWDRALSYLAQGALAEGWVEYSARLRIGELPQRDLPGQGWGGAPFPGQTLLVVAEQGFGDAIWVSRYLEKARALGGTLILECRPELARFFGDQGIADQIVIRGEALPPADFHIYQCSLPGLFTPDREAIPPAPYLTAPPDTSRFAEAQAWAKGKLRVGLIWSGSPTFKTNHERSLALDRLAGAFAVPGVALYSLQMGPAREELTSRTDDAVFDLTPLIEDFADSAAALTMLDLVIMTDSAVAHLAGAIGRPVWVLLSFSPYWLWGAEGESCDWYDSVRLFRSAAWNDWDGVLDRAAAQLIDLVCERPS